MIDFELKIYVETGYIPIPLSKIQAEVIVKALGLEFENGTYSHFDDETLQRVILSRLNFKEV